MINSKKSVILFAMLMFIVFSLFSDSVSDCYTQDNSPLVYIITIPKNENIDQVVLQYSLANYTGSDPSFSIEHVGVGTEVDVFLTGTAQTQPGPTTGSNVTLDHPTGTSPYTLTIAKKSGTYNSGSGSETMRFEVMNLDSSYYLRCLSISSNGNVDATFTKSPCNEIASIRIQDDDEATANDITSIYTTTDTGDEVTLYANAYDDSSNFLGPISVTWSISGGDFSDSNLSTTTGLSTVFQPRVLTTTGTNGTLTATYDPSCATTVLPVSITGITVAGSLSYIVVVDTDIDPDPGDNPTGNGVTSPPLNAGQTLTLYAAGYDSSHTFRKIEEATWSVVGVSVFNDMDNLSETINLTSTIFDPVCTIGDLTIRATHPTNSDDTELITVTGASSCSATPTAIITPDLGTTEHMIDDDTIYLITPALVNLDGSFSDPDTYTGDNPHNYSWTINEGLPNPDQNQTLTLETGQYDVSLIVTDAHNDSSLPESRTINVLPNPIVTFPKAKGVPYDYLKEPFIDGKLTGPDGQTEADGITIYGEHGWRGAHMFTFEGGGIIDGSAQFLRSRDDQFLYLGFEVDSDTTPISDDVIVLGFRNGSDDRLDLSYSAEGARLFYIYPVNNGSEIEATINIYQMNSGNWEGGSVDNSILYDDGDGWDVGVDQLDINTWALEAKIPISGSGLAGFGEEFMFFFDIFNCNSGGTVEQLHWPRDIDDVPDELVLGVPINIVDDRDNIYQFTPLWWGRADRSASAVANGLALPNYSHVGVRTNPGDTTLSNAIEYNEDNVFVANVLNNSQKDIYHDFSDGNGLVPAVETIPVNDVTVTFKIANWGIPPADNSYWQPIPATGGTDNPLTEDITASEYTPGSNIFPATEIVPQNHITEASFIWKPSLTPELVIGQTHQCILVELSTDNEADIVTKSVHRNMNFDALNDGPVIFIHPAEISAQGYGLPPQGDQEHKILLRIFTKTWNIDKDEVISIQEDNKRGIGRENPYFFETLPFILEADNTITFIEYIVKGYLYTGKKLIVRGEERELVEPIGSYGHIVRHIGPVEEWDFYIEGAERIDKHTYIITIPPEQTATIIDNVKAIEPPKYRIHISGGAIFPIGTFADDYKIGPNFILGAGYYHNPQYSLHLLFRYNYLYSNASGVDDTTLMSLSLNARRHFPLGNNFSFFAGIGGGAYFDTDSNVETGGNAGAGINFRLSRYMELEAGADYHYMIDSENQYIHGHAGVLFRF